MDKVNNLRDLFVDQLSDLYSAEQQVSKSLPKMAKNASSPDLRSAFDEHFEQTKRQIQRLDTIFSTLGMEKERGGAACAGMKGILSEGEETMKKAGESTVRDAALIASAQRAEHYEIAGYGTARAYAYALGENEAARLLQETLDEESQTDKRLTRIAESHINADAREE